LCFSVRFSGMGLICRVVVRDGVGVCGKFVERDRSLLERMVGREPFAPMSLMEMYSEYINGVTVSSEEPPSDTYSPKHPLTSPLASTPYISCISLPHISLPYLLTCAIVHLR
jgi:hypothetical protein